MIEVELKAWLSDYAATRAAVEREGAEFEKETEKRDLYYGPAGKAARDVNFEKDPIFRVRSEGEGRSVVATKRREPVEDGVEVNTEIEFEVADAGCFREFAQAIGFRPFIVKRKKSRKYKLGRATVELNRVDPLGDFIEIEVLVDDESEVPEAREEIQGLLARFGVPREKIETRLYIDLLRRQGVGRPDRGE